METGREEAEKNSRDEWQKGYDQARKTYRADAEQMYQGGRDSGYDEGWDVGYDKARRKYEHCYRDCMTLDGLLISLL